MGNPLRLAVLFVRPDELETIRDRVEAEGDRVEFRILERLDDLAGLNPLEFDAVVVAHAVDRADARGWLRRFSTATLPPLVILSEGEDDDPALTDELRQAGASAVVPIRHPARLVEAIRLALTFSANRASEAQRGLSEYRRMAGLMKVIGHNLRGVLGGIGNAVEVLSFQCPPGALSQRRTIALLDRQCRQMAGLLDDYAEVIRPQSENPRPLEVVELGASLNRAMDRAKTEVADDQVEFDRVPRPDPLWLKIDSSSLEHLVRHVLLYCGRRKHSAYRRIQLDWRADDGRIVLSFERSCEVAVPSRSSSPKDLDLDFYLASILAERLGGRMTPGSPFVVELPLLPAEGPSEPKLASAASSTDDRAVATSRHVLIVDDNLESIQALGLLIGRLGWHVRITSDVAEALQMIRTIRPGVVLIDLQMPVMDGQTFARVVRSEASIDCPRPLLIGITGTADVPKTDDQGRSCFDHFLTKPVRKDQIASLLPRLEQSA